MILGAALLVLVALGLFVAGLFTGDNVWYWSCVAAAGVAAVLLFVARRQLAEPEQEPAARRAPARSTSAPARREVAEDDGAAADRAVDADEDEAGRSREEPAPAEPAEAAGPAPEPVAAGAPTAAAASSDGAPAGAGAGGADGDPPAEDVEVSDLLLVVDMHDDVFVVDEHPRYHLADCPWLGNREAIPFPVDEARTDGFTPCGICCPDRYLAQVARARRAADTP